MGNAHLVTDGLGLDLPAEPERLQQSILTLRRALMLCHEGRFSLGHMPALSDATVVLLEGPAAMQPDGLMVLSLICCALSRYGSNTCERHSC